MSLGFNRSILAPISQQAIELMKSANMGGLHNLFRDNGISRRHYVDAATDLAIGYSMTVMASNFQQMFRQSSWGKRFADRLFSVKPPAYRHISYGPAEIRQLDSIGILDPECTPDELLELCSRSCSGALVQLRRVGWDAPALINLLSFFRRLHFSYTHSLHHLSDASHPFTHLEEVAQYCTKNKIDPQVVQALIAKCDKEYQRGLSIWEDMNNTHWTNEQKMKVVDSILRLKEVAPILKEMLQAMRTTGATDEEIYQFITSPLFQVVASYIPTDETDLGPIR